MTLVHPAPTRLRVASALRRWRWTLDGWVTALLSAPVMLARRPRGRLTFRDEVRVRTMAGSGLERFGTYLERHAQFEEYCRAAAAPGRQRDRSR
jgi:hypothetical protein